MVARSHDSRCKLACAAVYLSLPPLAKTSGCALEASRRDRDFWPLSGGSWRRTKTLPFWKLLVRVRISPLAFSCPPVLTISFSLSPSKLLLATAVYGLVLYLLLSAHTHPSRSWCWQGLRKQTPQKGDRRSKSHP